jgi:hypothetical protein
MRGISQTSTITDCGIAMIPLPDRGHSQHWRMTQNKPKKKEQGNVVAHARGQCCAELIRSVRIMLVVFKT